MKTHHLGERVPEKQFFFYTSKITTGCQTLFTYPTALPLPNRWGMG
jgi:hypothetical protein